MSNRSIHKLALFATLLLPVFGCASLSPIRQAELALEQMPAENDAERHVIFSRLAKGGPRAVLAVCENLQPPGEGDDTSARYAIAGLCRYVSRTGLESAREMVARALLHALESEQDPQVKIFLIERFELIGGAESIQPLSRYLPNDKLCDPVVRALSEIGGDQAAIALIDALPQTVGACRIGMIHALGDLRAEAAVPQLIALADSDDPKTRRAALSALANIGAPRAELLLARAVEAEDSPLQRRQAIADYLRFAARLAERGERQNAADICRELIESCAGPEEESSRCAALRTLVDIEGAEAMADLLDAVQSRNLYYRAAALDIVTDMPGSSVTQFWTTQCVKAEGEIRAAIIEMLAERGDAAALPAITAAQNSDELSVRLAAHRALHALDESRAVKSLIDVFQSDAPEEEIALAEALLRQTLSGGELEPLAAAYPEASINGCIAILKIIEARRGEQHVPLFLSAAAGEEATVRSQALAGLEALATPEHIPQALDLLLAASDAKERKAAQDVVVAASRRIEPPEDRADPIVARLSELAASQKPPLLELLPRLPAHNALSALRAHLDFGNPAVDAAAFQALLDWPDLSAADDLLRIAIENSGETRGVQAARRYVRLVQQQDDLSADRKMDRYEKVLPAVQSADQRRMLLAALSNTHSPRAFDLALEYLDDPEVQSEAALALIQLSGHCYTDDPGKILSALARVQASVDDENMREQARREFTEIADNTPNLALSKPVTVSRGRRDRQRAVDGIISDAPDTWYEADVPAWLQIDLGGVHTIDEALIALRLEDGRYYRYQLQTSLDGDNWRTAVDESDNTDPPVEHGERFHFPAVDARYVRLRMIESAGDYYYRLAELKVFPAPPGEWQPLFNGRDLGGWFGDRDGYKVQDGAIVCGESASNLYTIRQYNNFRLAFDFKLDSGANNGIGIRTPPVGDPAYVGMEIQVLDNCAPMYADLKPYQYHGSVYGIAPAKRGFLKPTGEWNEQEIVVDGRRIKVILNGETIVDVDLDEAAADGTMDGRPHPGLERETGHIGLCGHGPGVAFRNLRILEK